MNSIQTALKAGLRALAFFLALGIGLGGPAWAVEPDEVLADPALEARARELSKEIRCVVCQNQSIDDSNAGLAKDLRLLVRERLQAGDSDEEVIDFLVDRYGQFVLLKPRFSSQTLLLWIGGPLVLLIGGGAIYMSYRRKKGMPPKQDEELTSDERKELEELFRDE
ncbi:cytochrome c-type biogenesis protein [Polycladidibacter hongkongensis]|uniref:cytochrome c-type biogenesis protein n=1 Tax=Polycladidibacter hongkongensis TaxID=1647556 RepID=UPI000A8769E3|nr:cytochrome c-type biogenesis protein [Pseudovibrio hongkongensis]